ncbi:DUF6415 family natural product biosynthesis protein [Streptomyces sp. LN245]|uniref:DUF6415 family natural product biosynthesis protein n=1 Tax=Streptomyces sp. LN245 TaxID=3112975 RepID=UPI00371C7E64
MGWRRRRWPCKRRPHAPVSHVQDRMRPFAPTTPPPRAVLACVDEARRRLDAVPGHAYISEFEHARDPARSIEALCRHAVNATSSGADVPLARQPEKRWK